MKKYLYPADILLPDFSRAEGKKWACVACDQYTSEPEYWDRVEGFVGEAPSTLKLMLPEARLDRSAEAVPVIQATMNAYLEDGVFKNHSGCGIYLERTLASGAVRRGIVACIDLEDYDYSSGSVSAVRATEKTVAERIPPRLAVRRGAPLEMPHVMLLIDDPSDSVIGRFGGREADAYSFELMENSGSVRASFINKDEFDGINRSLCALAKGRKNPIVLAVGDGNHSLATAKAAFEEIKAQIGEKAAQRHPARYALVELVNIYDASLEFEPIYRLVKTDDPQGLIRDFEAALAADTAGTNAQNFEIITVGGKKTVSTRSASCTLSVTTLQRFLDARKKQDEITDYIHGTESLERLAARPGYVGFLFDGMRKEELFPSVENDGSLPRKTFSMGHACDKRFYIECRKIMK